MRRDTDVVLSLPTVMTVSFASIYWKHLLLALWTGERRVEVACHVTEDRELLVTTRRVAGLDASELEEHVRTRDLAEAYEVYAKRIANLGPRKDVPAFSEFVAAAEQALVDQTRVEDVNAQLTARSAGALPSGDRAALPPGSRAELEPPR